MRYSLGLVEDLEINVFPRNEEKESQPNARCFIRAGQRLANIGFHLLDYARITIVTQALAGRWVYQLIIELENYDSHPSAEAKHGWVGNSILCGSMVVAGAVKLANHLLGASYLALQDALFSVFSSSLLYVLLDDFCEQAQIEKMPAAVFWLTSAMIPVASLVLAKGYIADSTNHIVCRTQQIFPEFGDASKAEKALNVLATFSLGSGITTLFWVVNRELKGKTVPVDAWQIALCTLFYLAMVPLSFELTSKPKRFNNALIVSKALRDGALSYGALSGIGFHMMMLANGCSKEVCFDENDAKILTAIFIPTAASIGLFSALTARLDFGKKHRSNVKFINKFSCLFNRLPRPVIHGMILKQLHCCL